MYYNYVADQTTDLIVGVVILGGAAYAISQGYLGKAIDALLNIKLPSIPNLGGSSLDDAASDVSQSSNVPTSFTGVGNVSAKWSNGHARSFAGSDPDDPRVEVRADGGTAAKIDGKGNATVTGDRRRLYCYYNNYNAQLTVTLVPNFKGSGDDASLKMRSRHNEGGPAGPNCNGNNFGGYGFSVNQNGWESKREVCHNTHDQSIGGKLPQPLVNGRPVRIRQTVFDASGGVRQTGEIDYGSGFIKVMDIVDKSPKPWMVDKTLYMKKSYFWLRNNSPSGSCTFSNVTISEINPTAAFARANLVRLGYSAAQVMPYRRAMFAPLIA